VGEHDLGGLMLSPFSVQKLISSGDNFEQLLFI